MWLKIIYGGLFITLIYKFWNYYSKKVNLRKRVNKLPGPTPLPLIGNVLQIVLNHADLITLFMEFQKKWPKKWRLWLGHKFLIVLTNAADVQKLLSSKKHIEKNFSYEFLKPAFGTGLITSSGEKWRSRRKLITPLLNLKMLEDFVNVFNKQSEILIKQLSKEIEKDSCDIHPYITRCALDVICETVTGQHVNAQENHESSYLKAIEKAKSIVHSRQIRFWLWPDFLFNLFPSGREHAKCLHIFHGFSEKVIREKRNEWLKKSKEHRQSLCDSKNQLALLDLLLGVSDNEKFLSNRDICEEVNTFLVAGHDTTALTISCTMYLIGSHPDVQKKVHNELDSIFGTANTRITSKDIKEMKYLDCVIKESLRLFPPAPMIGRHIKEDLQLDDYTIPASASVVVLIYMLHRDPIVFPDPEKFDPDRFLPENAIGRHPYAYIPFSAGPRNCIGQQFALMEIKVILAQIFRLYNIKSLEPRDQIKIACEPVIKLKNKINLKLKKRE